MELVKELNKTEVKQQIENLIYSADTLNMFEKLAIVESIFKVLEGVDNIDELAIDLNQKLESAGVVRKKKIGEFDSNQEWYTPVKYIEMARSVMGTIDTDPASNEVAQQWIKAKIFYTKEDDGYRQAWIGNVWCNPPYGRDVKLHYGSNKSAPVPSYWLARALELYEKNQIQQITFLLNRTGAAWYQEKIPKFSAICEVKKRIAFHDCHGNSSSGARYYNDFLYLGARLEQFERVFSQIGRITRF